MPKAKSTKSRAIRATGASTRTSSRSASNRSGRNNIFSNRNRGVGVIVALAIATVSLVGVAVAALSTDLTINGSATVQGGAPINWDIHFYGHPAVEKTFGAAEVVTQPTLSTDKLSVNDYAVTFKAPGDKVWIYTGLKNAGNIDAKVDKISIKTGSELTCAPAGAEADKVCQHINYTLHHENDRQDAPTDLVQVGDVYKSNASAEGVYLVLELDDGLTAEDWPTNDVTISGLDVDITFAPVSSNETTEESDS